MTALTEEQKRQRMETRRRNAERKRKIIAAMDAQRAEHLRGMGERRILHQGRGAIRLRIIELGYRALAKEFHPDRGGSADDMRRLTEAKDDLLNMNTRIHDTWQQRQGAD
jgi:hypothetical protein